MSRMPASECGACTVLVNGARINACLSLAVMHDGDAVTTIEGVGTPDHLHPIQTAFLTQDAYQCGYCTPGQICSTIGMLSELAAGVPSQETPAGAAPMLNDAEIRERMSGNICRCSAYPQIVAAIRDAARRAIDAAAAVKAAAATAGSRFIAGGTNLLDLMKLEIETPAHLIDVSRLDLAGVEATPQGGLRIGAAASNSAVAADPQVRARYPVLSEAIVAGGSAQLRNKAPQF
eukprot:gene59527-81469_t